MMKKSRRKKTWASGRFSHAGYTMTEVLVAFSLLAVGVVAVLEAIGTGMRAARKAELRTQMTMLAREKLEEIRKEPQINEARQNGDFGQQFPGFSWEAQISKTEFTGLDLVAVKVILDEAGQREEYLASCLKAETPTAFTPQTSAGTTASAGAGAGAGKALTTGSMGGRS